MNVDLKRFDNPDEVRTFEKGKFEILHIGGMTMGALPISPAGNGRPMSELPWEKPAVTSSMLEWSFPDERQPPCTMVL